MSPSTLRAVVLAVLAAITAAGCGKDTTTTTPTTTSTTDIRNNETFSASLSVGQSQFYSFSTISPGTTDVTLISIRPAGSIATTLSPVVGLGLGQPQGTDCALSNATTTTPGLKSQLTVTTNISVYCVKIADVGNLTGTVDYTIRVVHP